MGIGAGGNGPRFLICIPTDKRACSLLEPMALQRFCDPNFPVSLSHTQQLSSVMLAGSYPKIGGPGEGFLSHGPQPLASGLAPILSPQRFHKPHHLWKIATPFASHAFHPVDGFMQSLPYHVYPFLFPLHKITYLGLYIFVNVWTISIHDGDYRVPRPLRHVINGSAHHTDHHLYFDYNYGQYFTLWDKIGGSYKSPTAFEGKGPHDYMRKLRENGSACPNGDTDKTE